MIENSFVQGFNEELEKIAISQRGKKWLKGLGIGTAIIGGAALTGLGIVKAKSLVRKAKNLSNVRKSFIRGTSQFKDKEIKELKEAISKSNIFG